MKSLSKEIINEAKSFVKKNKGFSVGDDGKYYQSPRISSEFMDCSMPLTFDHMSHCSLGCTYCFAYAFKSNKLHFKNNVRTVNVDALKRMIHGEGKNIASQIAYEHFFKKRFLFHWGGLADPFCNFEKSSGVGYEIISELARIKYPTLFSFKGGAIKRPKYMKLFEKHAHNKNFAFQVSIVAPSDKASRSLEIGVPVTSQRIKMIKMLSDMGYYTILRLRPFIIGITDIGLEDLLYKCKEAGINAISTEFFALDSRQAYNEGLSKRYEHIGELIGTDNVMEYYKTLSPSRRGSYQRLNRLVKERFVKIMYKFCLENDILFACSDPDYKELNMSGSCCGMPDHYPENKELENWSRSQLTFAIKEARKEYHTTNSIKKLKFETVFKPKVDTFLDEPGFDAFATAHLTASESYYSSHLVVARNVWNNLRSPANPRNYFHHQLLPVTVDSNGNYIFKYNPSDYEKRWKAEGIDLTK